MADGFLFSYVTGLGLEVGTKETVSELNIELKKICGTFLIFYFHFNQLLSANVFVHEN